MGYIHPEEEKHMAKKKSRTREVRMPDRDKDNVVGVISPLEIHLKTRRPAVRPGQIMKSKRDDDRAALKRKLWTEDA